MKNVKALLFDVFGTVVDWRTSVEAELKALGAKHGVDADWAKFAQEWRDKYFSGTKRVAVEGAAFTSVDAMHRQILDQMLASPEWSSIAPLWSEEELQELNLVWHRLGGWPDSSEGLRALKKNYIIATLSNGNVKLLVDMAKYTDLPWDAVFSGEMFQSYKPNPKTYLGAIQYLSLQPHEVAMVAAHIFDIRAASKLGMPSVYVVRPQEEADPHPEAIKTKAEGGDADIIVSSFLELADILEEGK
ncbi:HAD-like domain-containing protein [Ephemerocybe angulata]|uniref:HAD-like domain-containing protein n=1 Tax=Ephemerocybe angulata TaxID=980116 RepID=A0A8H6M2G3_9AGAR|nr:HAD-like domain-containing protein [Tulosesus angulatus]